MLKTGAIVGAVLVTGVALGIWYSVAGRATPAAAVDDMAASIRVSDCAKYFSATTADYRVRQRIGTCDDFIARYTNREPATYRIDVTSVTASDAHAIVRSTVMFDQPAAPVTTTVTFWVVKQGERWVVDSESPE